MCTYIQTFITLKALRFNDLLIDKNIQFPLKLLQRWGFSYFSHAIRLTQSRKNTLCGPRAGRRNTELLRERERVPLLVLHTFT